jgi:phosphatidylserine/phosphatidylglycerophosphate/cardiolipin synthase-like enzyme
VIIVDEKYLLIGSHNWSESALKYNHEVTVKISSKELAKEAKEYFEMIWSKGRKV